MKNKRPLLAALLSLLILTAAGWTANSPAPAWEYKVSQVIKKGLGAMPAQKIEDEINTLAREGWELMAVERDAPGVTVTLYFKRQK